MVRHNEEGRYRSSETAVTTKIDMDEKFRWMDDSGYRSFVLCEKRVDVGRIGGVDREGCADAVIGGT